MKKARLILGLLMLLCLCFPAHAMDMQYFKQMPLMHEGRVKPLGRMAQLTLQQISGEKQTIDNSTIWLADLLFDPGSASQPKLFKIENRQLRHKLALVEKPQPNYDFAEMNEAMIRNADNILLLRTKNAGDLTKLESELVKLYTHVILYEQLKDALTLILPLKTEGNKPVRFINLSTEKQQQEIYRTLLAKGKNNVIFLGIPKKTIEGISWTTPWMNYTDKPDLLNYWGDLADAYVFQDAAAWESASKNLYESTLQNIPDPILDLRLKTELFYLELNPYLISMAFYGLGLLLLVLKRNRLVSPVVAFGLVFHITGIICRIFILQRPPVSDLYESLLFVGALVVFISLIYGWRRKDNTALLAGSIFGVILHGAGFALSGDYDTLKVLQAVLDTKFWLATHVLIITAGYALCLLTSGIAHYCLWYYPASRKIRNNLYIFALVSLVFVSTGTLLGGVWADQSWGRFWGWDPKENGALLIALWLIWLLHGKVSRHVSDFFFVMGLAGLSMIVALSWIGINLLGVGLHSYGFLQGSATTLLVLFALESAFFLHCWKRHNA